MIIIMTVKMIKAPYLVYLSTAGISKCWVLTTSFAEVPDQGLTMMMSIMMIIMIMMILVTILRVIETQRSGPKCTSGPNNVDLLDVTLVREDNSKMLLTYFQTRTDEG